MPSGFKPQAYDFTILYLIIEGFSYIISSVREVGLCYVRHLYRNHKCSPFNGIRTFFIRRVFPEKDAGRMVLSAYSPELSTFLIMDILPIIEQDFFNASPNTFGFHLCLMRINMFLIFVLHLRYILIKSIFRQAKTNAESVHLIGSKCFLRYSRFIPCIRFCLIFPVFLS